MRSYVINLKKSTGKLEAFKLNNSQYLPDLHVFEARDGSEITHAKLLELGFDTRKSWRDPLLKRTLTHGEVGCFLSHYLLWERCVEFNEPFLIFEDDVVVDREIPDNLAELADDGILYLLWNELIPNKYPSNNEPTVKLAYPYWLAAYVVTPAAAKVLIESFKEIIPADEYVPFLGDRISLRGLKDSPVTLKSTGSTTEPKSRNDYFIDFKTHVVTIASDIDKADKLYESAKRHNIDVINLWPEGAVWNGGLQNFSTGGGVKANLLTEYIEGLPDDDLVILTDAYDVFFCDTTDEIVRRFLSFKCEVLFQAEQYNWPDESLMWPPTNTKYRYLCSGVIIGRVAELNHILAHGMSDNQSDQLYYQHAYLSKRFNCKLDTEMYVSASNDSAIVAKNNQVFNPYTKCYSCIYHGNGGKEAKLHFNKLYRQIYPKRNYLSVSNYKIIGNEMLLIDYKTPDQCQEWIDISERHGGWSPHPDDLFPSHDIHLNELGLMEEAEAFFKQVAAPIMERHWKPMHHTHLRKAFTMKYSPETQKTLGLHNDSSMITGSVKLNDDYEGATLYWPRQKVDNKHIPVGKMILFPGQVTHGHYVDELTSGTKYSATFWTARYKGDYL